MLSKWSAGHQRQTACDKYKAMPSIFFKYNFWIKKKKFKPETGNLGNVLAPKEAVWVQLVSYQSK